MLYILKQCQRELDDFPDEVKEELSDAIAQLNLEGFLGMPLSRPMPVIGKGVHELRFRDASGIYRVIYVLVDGKGIFLLHAFKKKTEQTTRSNIQLAKQRLKEIQ